jgi:hypothetical protein
MEADKTTKEVRLDRLALAVKRMALKAQKIDKKLKGRPLPQDGVMALADLLIIASDLMKRSLAKSEV